MTFCDTCNFVATCSRSVSHFRICGYNFSHLKWFLRTFTCYRGLGATVFLSTYVEYIVKMNRKMQKKAGYPVFVWAVESGTFLARLTHFGVLRNDLGVMKPFKCTKAFLKGRGNFGTTFQNFPSTSFRFRHPGGKNVATTPSRS